MKKHFFPYLILLVTVLYFPNTLYAQLVPRDIIDVVNNSDYIIEGTVIRSDAYWGTQRKVIYTSHTLQISRIFKGDLQCGTVEIITLGGRVGDTELSVTHNITLSEGDKGIFACKDMYSYEMSGTNYYPESNDNVLQIIYGQQGYFRYFEDEINDAVANPFYNFDSLAQAYDAIELITQINYTDCLIDPIVGQNDNHSTNKVSKKPFKGSLTHYEKSEHDRLIKEMQDRINSTSPAKMQLTSNLSYSIENVEITGTSPRFLEYDIYLAADDNLSYLEAGLVHIEYDTIVFSSNIVNAMGVTVTRGTIIASAIDYQDPTPADNAANIIAIPFTTYIDPANRYNLDTNPTQVVHVKMQMIDCIVNGATIAFTNQSTMEYLSRFTTSANAPSSSMQFYSSITANDIEVLPQCKPQIIDFYPKTVNAGVGDIVEIDGKFFGEPRPLNSGVFLKDANDGSASDILLEDYDIVDWKDEKIKIKVPTIKMSNISQSFVAGSGDITVTVGHYFTNTNLISPLNIHYAIANRIGDAEKRSAGLVDALGPDTLGYGGYEFHTYLYNPNTINNQPALSVIRKAINEWNCLTGVHFTLGDTLINWTKIIDEEDKINVIQFGDLSALSALAITSQWIDVCSTAPIENPYMKEVDIIVDYGYQWMYDTTGTQWVNFPYRDFYAVLLHELGHAHLLDHISDPLALMYFAQLQTPIQPADRPIYLNTEISCKDGGDYVLFRSGAVTYGNCIVIDTLIPKSGYGCTPFNAVEETGIPHNIVIYPNPFENKIQIAFWRDIPYFQVEIYDITGKLFYEKKCTNTAQQEIDLSLLPQGVYYLKLHNNLFNYQQIIIKQ